MINSLNFSYCLQKSSNIGNTKFFNVCDQTQHVVPWGSLDWFAFLIPASVMLTILGALAYIAGMLAYEAYKMNAAYRNLKKSMKITVK